MSKFAPKVEYLLFERSYDTSFEKVRTWWNRFGPTLAPDIRRQRVGQMKGFRHWRWHLDEMFVKINGRTHYLWRAVDHEGRSSRVMSLRNRTKRQR